MKKIFTILLICFAAFNASSQNIKSSAKTSLYLDKSTNSSDKNIDRKFLDSGNTLLNLNGSLPKHVIGKMKVNEDKSKIFSKPEQRLITNNLLFTGKLSDFISEPFWLTPAEKSPNKD